CISETCTPPRRAEAEGRGAPGRRGLTADRITRPSPRRGLPPWALRLLDQERRWRKRERERERCISAADASTYGPKRARGNPPHVCPGRTHAKAAPHRYDRYSLSQEFFP